MKTITLKKITLSLLLATTLGLADGTLNDAYNYIETGIKYYKQGNYREALSYYQKSLLIYEEVLGLDHLNAANTYHNIGVLYQSMGDYSKSLEYAQKSLAIREKVLGSDHADSAQSYNHIGALYNSMGDYPKALSYYQKALTIYEKVLGVDHPDTAISYNNIGALYHSMGNYPKALNYYQKALAIDEKVLGLDHASTATSYNNIGALYKTMGDYPKALSYYQKALAIDEKVLGLNHAITATIYDNIGSNYDSMGDYPNALEYHQKALAIREKVLGLNHADTASSYNHIGLSYQSIGNYQKSYEYAKKSFDSFIVQRDSAFAMLDNRGKEAFMKSNAEKPIFLLRSAYIYVLATSSKKDEIFTTTMSDWFNYKGSVYDSENMMAMLYRTTTDKGVRSTIERLNTQKVAYAKLQQNPPQDEKEIQSYKAKNVAILKEIDSLEQSLASKVTGYQEELGLRKINYKKVSAKLRDGELYLDFVYDEDAYYLFSLDKNGVVDMNLIDAKSVDELVGNFRKDIGTVVDKSDISAQELKNLTASSKTKLNALYEKILYKPLETRLSKASSLIISTDGALRLLPFEALCDSSGKYLIETKNIRYTPSAKEFLRGSKEGSKSVSKKMPIFFNPNYDAAIDLNENKVAELNTPNTNTDKVRSLKAKVVPRFGNLEGTVKEANNIKTIFGSSVLSEFSGNIASEQNLQNVKNPRILHIATHGYFLNDETIPNPMLKAGIALKGANQALLNKKDEGMVTALKLSGLSLKDTELVVVSACETGMVNPKSTENVSALSKAFLQAGASNVIVTLWTIADNETADIMKLFYQDLKNGKDVQEALKNSKLKMIKEEMHPFYWAGFVMNGKVQSSKSMEFR